jgi:hypothetical protein
MNFVQADSLDNLVKQADIETDQIGQKLADFLNQKDLDVSTLTPEIIADNIGVTSEQLIKVAFYLVASILGFGKSHGSDKKFDPEKIKKGMEVESEHTSSPILQLKIVLDHLNEDEMYYEKLATIEKE